MKIRIGRMITAGECNVTVRNERSYTDALDLAPVFLDFACMRCRSQKIALDHFIFREDHRKIREKALCRIELICCKQVLAFSHHGLIHHLFYCRDPLITVVTDKTFVIAVNLCIFLYGCDVITFLERILCCLDITCSRLDKIQFTEQRVCRRREVTDRLELVEEIRDDRLFDLAQKEFLTDAVKPFRYNRARKLFHGIEEINITRRKNITVADDAVAQLIYMLPYDILHIIEHLDAHHIGSLFIW